MMDMLWVKDDIRNMLIRQQREYSEKGLVFRGADSDELFYSCWLNHRQTMLALIPEMCQKAGTHTLDVGGGEGRIATILSDFGMNCVIDDIIYSKENLLNIDGQPLIPLLRDYLEGKGVKIISNDPNVEGIPLPDNSLDLVICSEVIEHLPNSPKPLLQEIFRILKKPGWLILSTPNRLSLSKRLKPLLGYSTEDHIDDFYNMKTYPRGEVYRGHNREYTIDEVKYMLSEESFLITKCISTNLCPDVETLYNDIKYIMSTVNNLSSIFNMNALKKIIYYLIENLSKNYGLTIFVLAKKT
ncbi:MAG: class I SAM-dependent methyltransferase [Desulfobaccales bacterium]